MTREIIEKKYDKFNEDLNNQYLKEIEVICKKYNLTFEDYFSPRFYVNGNTGQEVDDDHELWKTWDNLIKWYEGMGGSYQVCIWTPNLEQIG